MLSGRDPARLDLARLDLARLDLARLDLARLYPAEPARVFLAEIGRSPRPGEERGFRRRPGAADGPSTMI
ncbi:hypothetical protein [Actinoplanes sp. NBRC 101535]|uniref:hypothetical protein n=1 Tax=Actinoplanes sp. NBRC 101535 TaxID=3032196 RepID=UPI0024A21B88|nr:hypothetical protein [Actinoplanes sp. NBRC 101535]GLX99893.1 hypothetical protein Acsp01_02730 [Actinoplanes sp. NBRC 101535]